MFFLKKNVCNKKVCFVKTIKIFINIKKKLHLKSFNLVWIAIISSSLKNYTYILELIKKKLNLKNLLINILYKNKNQNKSLRLTWFFNLNSPFSWKDAKHGICFFNLPSSLDRLLLLGFGVDFGLFLWVWTRIDRGGRKGTARLKAVESGGCHEFRRSASAKQVSMIIPGVVF
jgi:hypothetical protein